MYWMIYFNIVFTLLVLVHFIFFNRKGESTWNRYILLLFPLISFAIVHVKTTIIQPDILPTIYLPTIDLGGVSEENSSTSINYWLLIYLIGIGLSLMYHFTGILNVFKLKKRSVFIKKIGKISLYKSELNGSFFKLVFLTNPNDEIILTHELAHVKQRHSIDRLLALALQTVLWFNPFVYIYNRMIAENHEFLADEKVLEKEHAESYATFLVNQTMRNLLFESLNPISKMSNLKIRVMKMYEKSKLKKGWYLILPAVTIALLVFSCKEEPLKNESPVAQVSFNTNDTIIDFPDKEAEFSGGIEAMTEYLSTNIVYPESAVESGKQGKVFVEFIIEQDGSITNTKILRGVSETIDKEAIRVISTMPKWKPAEHEGQKVRARARIPLNFMFSEDN